MHVLGGDGDVEGDGDADGDGDGGADGLADGDAVGEVVGVTPPVHVTPFMAKLDGAGLLPVQDPLNPNDTMALVGTDPL
ncbi:hypothetical protein GCM10028775_77780 [Catellatospora paridis]